MASSSLVGRLLLWRGVRKKERILNEEDQRQQVGNKQFELLVVNKLSMNYRPQRPPLFNHRPKFFLRASISACRVMRNKIKHKKY
jgi:hypothetical protein